MTLCLGGHLLVSFFFYDMTSLQPPSFHRNDFPLVPLIFHFRAKPQQERDVVLLALRAHGP